MLDMVLYNMKLLAVIKKRKIDVIYSNCIRGALSIGLAAKISRTPHLWYIKGELENRLLDTIGFALADKILFFCESNKHDKHPNLVKRYEKKIDILKIGINPATIIEIEQKDKAMLTKELFIDQQHTHILYLGQLYAPKGVHYLLEAIGLIAKEFPNIKLYIVGDPILDEYMGYKEKLVHIVQRYKLTNTVVFTGWRTDALEILSLMDILVHPSLKEGFGRAVLEAMALGKPVVASKVGGLREIIEDGENGFLVEPGNSMEIAEKLSILLKDKELRTKFGKSAREKVFSEYLIQDKILRLEQIWAEMVQKTL
jgi:glycosyltransferase involved in cell wall biosynthesis